MYLYNKSLFTRSRTVAFFTPGVSPGSNQRMKSFNPGLQTGTPVGDGTPMNVQVNPDGTIGSNPQSQVYPGKLNQQQRKSTKKATEPMTAMKIKQKEITNPKMTMTKDNERGKPKKRRKPIHWPRGKRPGPPEPEVDFTTNVQTPEGQEFYRDGARYTTDTERMGKLSPIRTLRQKADFSNGGHDTLGQIRSHFQTIRAQFLPQLPSYETDAADKKLDTIQRDIWRTMYKQMRNIYQQHKSINTAFEQVFTEEKLYLYFYDTFALYAELICLIQMAAYYLNESNGCDNVVLSNVANTLNKNSFHNLRNDMARVLRFSYLPGELCKETYEMFQAYRVGIDKTSGTMRFATPAMSLLIKELAASTVQNSTESNVQGVHQAIAKYTSTIDDLINNVIHGRTGNPSTQKNPPRRITWNTTDSTPDYNQFTKIDPYIFPDGRGIISNHERQQLEGYLEVVARSANLKLLNSLEQGNSQTAMSDSWSDMWNNSCLTARQGDGSDWFWPSNVGGGKESDASDAPWISPSHTENVLYCSDTDHTDIQYKSVQFMLQRFAGYSSLFWVQVQDERDCNMNRWYLEERDPRVNLHQDDDIRADFKHGHVQFTGGITKPFISDNYVTKLFQVGTNTFYSFNNPDSQSAGQWYLTLGDLRDKQYNRGIDYLS